jgi:thiamine-phosphate pyrophosphorylase
MSTPELLQGEAEVMVNLFEHGLSCLHIRKPQSDFNELKNLLEQIPSHFHSRLVLHQHHAMCEKYNLKGLHFTEKNRLELTKHHLSELRKKNPGLTFSTSFHDLFQMRESCTPFDYAFFGPVFNSISKQNYRSRTDIKDIGHTLLLLKSAGTTCRIVALGGITVNKLPVLKKSGFDGIGVLGAIWESHDPLKEFLELTSVGNFHSI